MYVCVCVCVCVCILFHYDLFQDIEYNFLRYTIGPWWPSILYVIFASTKPKIAGRNVNNLRYADDTTLMAESEEDVKSLLMMVKEEREKSSLKLNIQKMKIMSFDHITWWQIDGETMETLRDFVFLGPKITADGSCSHEIKRCLLLQRKAMTNLE